METALSTGKVGARLALSAAGALAMIGGLLVLTAELRADVRTVESLVTGAVATAGGAALIFLPRLGVSATPAGVLTAVVTAVIGTASGWLRTVETTGGLYAYLVGRGFPFTFIRRGATGETPGAAKAEALSHSWNIHGDALAADAAFWGLAGVLVAVAAALLRRTIRTAAE